MPKLSIVVGYRNREVLRVERFLSSLANQTFTDFELLLVDYGSDPDYAQPVKEISATYPFCRYIFSQTAGMFWNRSHALNTGIKQATGEFVICTDIDMVFSSDVLERAVAAYKPGHQCFCQIYLVPGQYKNYDRLTDEKPDFKLTSKAGKGGFHMVPRESLIAIRGFDEFYRMWGKEDNDCAQRLENSGLKVQWLDPKSVRIYHQWHKPSMNKDYTFPQWWWDEMSIHFSLSKNTLERNTAASWGAVITADDRPVLGSVAYRSLNFPGFQNAYERAAMLDEIIALARESNGSIIEVHTTSTANQTLQAETHGTIKHKLLKLIGHPEAKKLKSHSTLTLNSLQYLILKLSENDGPLKDYAINFHNDNSITIRFAFDITS